MMSYEMFMWKTGTYGSSNRCPDRCGVLDEGCVDNEEKIRPIACCCEFECKNT